MFRRFGLLGSLIAAGFISAGVAAPSAIDRLTELYLPPEFDTPKISPTGEYASFIARHGDDFAAGTFTFATRKIGYVATKGIIPVEGWWKTPRQLLIETTRREYNSKGYTLVDINGSKSEDAWRLVGAFIIDPLPDDPRNVFVSEHGDVGIKNLDSGVMTSTDMLGGGRKYCFLDGQHRFRAAFETFKTGNLTFWWRDTGKGDWRKQEFQPGEKVFEPVGFDDDPRYLWILDETQGGEAVVSRFDTATGERVVVVRRVGLDPTHFLYSGNLLRPIGVAYMQGPTAVLVPLNEKYRGGLEILQKKFGDFTPEIIDASNDPHRWFVRLQNSRVPGIFALFDSTTGDLQPVMRSHGRELSEARLVPGEYFEFRARSGTKMSGRLWRPAGVARPPLVVLTPSQLPGKPARDEFDSHIQALVELGFAVARVNVRGIWGFGIAQRSVPESELAQSLTEDLEDAVNALVDQHAVDGRRVAVMGKDLSGMLALLVAKKSQRFGAVVALNAPARLKREDLLRLTESGGVTTLSSRLGGWSQSAALIEQMSPIVVAPQIKIPALYMYNEEGIKGRMEQSGRDIQSATKAAGVPAQFDLAFSFSVRQPLPTVRAHEAAVIVVKMADFLTKSLPAEVKP
jgi:dienelactone hydrolase